MMIMTTKTTRVKMKQLRKDRWRVEKMRRGTTRRKQYKGQKLSEQNRVKESEEDSLLGKSKRAIQKKGKRKQRQKKKERTNMKVK